jgi:hypothetical protein
MRETNNKVVQINRGAFPKTDRQARAASSRSAGGASLTFLETYCDTRDAGRIPEEGFLRVGAVFAAGFIPTVLSLYGGVLPLSAFATVTLAGLLWGLVRYCRRPGETPFLRGATRPAPQSPAGEAEASERALDEAA